MKKSCQKEIVALCKKLSLKRLDYQIKSQLQYDGPVLIIARWQFVGNVDGVILVGHCTGTPQKSSTEAEMKSMNLMPATSWADHATNSSHIEATH